jgi:hypothetical protein
MRSLFNALRKLMPDFPARQTAEIRDVPSDIIVAFASLQYQGPGRHLPDVIVLENLGPTGHEALKFERAETLTPGVDYTVK